MKLAVIVSPAAGWHYDELARLAQETERTGAFESFWVSDHFFGGEGFPDRDCLEAWTLLAALARDTKTIRLGCLVAAAQYRNPALLAKIVAGVDQMSGGRLEFGIGAGWKENEYEAYGYDFAEPGTRVDQMVEAIDICKLLWTQERSTYAGKHYRVTDAVAAPKPAQKPHPPLWIGGKGARVKKLAARMADGFDIGWRGEGVAKPYFTEQEMRTITDDLDALCKAEKRTRPLMKSTWSPVDDDAALDAVRTRAAEYGRAGLDRWILAFQKDRALEMVKRVSDAHA